MSQTSNRFSVMLESNDFLKTKHESNTKDNHSGSLGDLTRAEFKHPNTHITREDSISSNKSSLSSLFRKSFEGPWSSGSISGLYTPRPDKTLCLFETIILALNDMYNKYSKLTASDSAVETQDYNEICIKLDDRMNMIHNFMTDYRCLIEDKQMEFNKIDSNLRSLLSNKHSKESIDSTDNEAYWQTCKELFVIESKLERCSGKLQFQIMELDFIGKISPLDQYELTIRLNETMKFKTRIKIEKNGHQVWDFRNFSTNPVIDDFLYIKFSEMKALNKSTVLLEKKLPFINNLIRSEPSIFSLWLSPVGTIKLNVIVQWNSVLDDPGLQTYLTGIDCKFSDQSSKNDLSVRNKFPSSSHKYTSNRLSINVESLFRSNRMDKDSRCSSMGNITEDVEEDKISKEISRKLSKEMRLSDIPLPKVEVKNNDKIAEIKVEHFPFLENSEKFCSVKINVTGNDETPNYNETKSQVSLLKQESIDIELAEEISFIPKIEENISSRGEYDIVRGNVDNKDEDNIVRRSVDNMNEDDIVKGYDKIKDEDYIARGNVDTNSFNRDENLQREVDLRNDDCRSTDVDIVQENAGKESCEVCVMEIENIITENETGARNHEENNIEIVTDGDSPTHTDNLASLSGIGGTGDDNQDPMLSMKNEPASHIYGCEDNGLAIESPIVTLSPFNNSVEDANEEPVKSLVENSECIDSSLASGGGENVPTGFHCEVDQERPIDITARTTEHHGQSIIDSRVSGRSNDLAENYLCKIDDERGLGGSNCTEAAAAAVATSTAPQRQNSVPSELADPQQLTADREFTSDRIGE